MLLVEVPGSKGADAPEHIVREVPNGKEGVIFGLMVTLKVTGTAQMPPEGVNVYVAEFWLSITVGLQVPLTPFVELFGREGIELPAQAEIDVPKLNTGTVLGVTFTFSEVVVAHCPAVGVNVYVPVVLLSIVAGVQVPVMPLFDVEGSDGTLAPAQILRVVPKLKPGVMFGFTVTLNVAGLAHTPELGVNV
jgi:hypothetical protein